MNIHLTTVLNTKLKVSTIQSSMRSNCEAIELLKKDFNNFIRTNKGGTNKMNIYLINYSTKYEVEALNEKDYEALMESEAIPEFEEITKDWNDYVKQTVIDKVNEIIGYNYGFDEINEEEFKWVEEEWLTLDTKYSRIYGRIYGQINRKKIIKCLDNENNNEAMIIVYEIKL